MNVLVATTQTQGHRPGDFFNAVPGELVTIPGHTCGSPACGCDRSWVGATSRAGTTTAIVADLPFTRDQYVQALTDSEAAACGGDISPNVGWLADKLLRIADHFDEGDVLERYGDTIETR